MSEKELKSLRNLLKGVITALIVNIIVIIGGVWWASAIDQRVSHIESEEIEIKENMIDENVWKYNDYFTRYLWAERWNQTLPEPPYNTRGAAPNL